MPASRQIILSDEYLLFGMRIIGSEARLGLYNTRLGENLGQGKYGYDSVSDTSMVFSWIKVLDFG